MGRTGSPDQPPQGPGRALEVVMADALPALAALCPGGRGMGARVLDEQGAQAGKGLDPLLFRPPMAVGEQYRDGRQGPIGRAGEQPLGAGQQGPWIGGVAAALGEQGEAGQLGVGLGVPEADGLVGRSRGGAVAGRRGAPGWRSVPGSLESPMPQVSPCSRHSLQNRVGAIQSRRIVSICGRRGKEQTVWNGRGRKAQELENMPRNR